MNDQFPREISSEGDGGGEPPRRSSSLLRLLEALTHFGLGETALRIGRSVLAVSLVAAVIALMQFLYQQANLGQPPAESAQSTAPAAEEVDLRSLPVDLSSSPKGVARLARPHTIIPSRPRTDVIKYTVQPGDNLFKIAEKFGLKPTTILFGNWETLHGHPNLVKPGQELNILPVDGAYYQWNVTDSLNAVAKGLYVDPEVIVNYPGNHLDPETIGDYDHPNIPDGTWLIVPGGRRDFTSWTAPPVLVRMDPRVGVWGPGLCEGIKYVQVGTGTFIHPTVEHWLSGTPFMPEVGHWGVDFAGNTGNAVYAVDAGTVVYSGWNNWGYGWLVIIDHGNGWESRYAHLSSIAVGCGQNVGQGDLIGGVGMTGGTSTGPHLHFELFNVNYGRVNPLLFLPPP